MNERVQGCIADTLTNLHAENVDKLKSTSHLHSLYIAVLQYVVSKVYCKNVE